MDENSWRAKAQTYASLKDKITSCKSQIALAKNSIEIFEKEEAEIAKELDKCVGGNVPMRMIGIEGSKRVLVITYRSAGQHAELKIVEVE